MEGNACLSGNVIKPFSGESAKFVTQKSKTDRLTTNHCGSGEFQTGVFKG